MARSNVEFAGLKSPGVAVPENGTMETQPSCLYVENQLDILAVKECNTSKVTCGNCDEKHEEASYCFHCGKFWCQGCLNAHNILKENKEHRVLAVRDFKDKDFEDVLSKERITGTALKSNIASRLDAAKKSSKTISGYIQRLEETSRLLEYRSKTIKQQIQQTTKSLIMTLQQKEQGLLAEEENETKKALEQLRKQKGQFQDQLIKGQQSISHIEYLLQCRTGEELERNKTFIDELFRGLLEEPHDPGMPSTNDWKTVPVFMQNEKVSESLLELGIGHLVTNKSATEATQCSVEGFQAATAGLETEIEVITRNPEGKQCYCPGDYITVELISTQDRNTAVEMKIINKNNGSYKVSFIPSEAGQHLLTVHVNGENIREFPPIEIKERSFVPLRFIAKGSIQNSETLTEISPLSKSAVALAPPNNLSHPWGVASNDPNEIFVSDMDNNRIVVFNEKGEFIRSFGQSLLYKPTGMCIDNEGRVYVANRGNNKILLFNAEGEYITAVHNGELFQEPRQISLNAQGNLFVCDVGNQCIQLISPNGSILKTIGKGGLRKPVGCLCYEDKVFVSDYDAHLIKVYNVSDGRFLYEFGRHDTVDVELNEPIGLAVDKERHLLVCSGYSFDNPHRILVYTLDGKFVTMFGGLRGRGLGQFIVPTSVTVLRSGRLVVCEFENCRLQMFE